MEEQVQNNPIIEPQPQVVSPAVVTIEQPEVPGKKSRATLYMIIGVVVLLVGFAVTIVLLSSSSSEDTETAPAATVSAEVKSTEDLNKVDEELDTSDLDSYEADLNLNDSDAASF